MDSAGRMGNGDWDQQWPAAPSSSYVLLAPIWVLPTGSSPSENVQLLQHGVLHGLQGNNCSALVASRGCRGMSAPVFGALSPPSCLILVSAGSFSHISPHPSPPYSVFPFLKCVYPEMPPPWLGTVGLSCTLQWVCWSCLKLALCSMGQLQPSLAKTTSSAPYCKNSDLHSIQTTVKVNSPTLIKI